MKLEFSKKIFPLPVKVNTLAFAQPDEGTMVYLQTEKSPMTSKDYFLQLTILYGAMIAGVFIFLVVSSFLQQESGPLAPELHEMFQYLIPALALGALLGSSALFKYQLRAIPQQASLIEKMNHYRSARIVQYALLDAGAIMGAVGYLLVGHWLYLTVAGLMLGLFLLNRPGPSQAVNDLELTGDEAARVQNPQAIIADTPPRGGSF